MAFSVFFKILRRATTNQPSSGAGQPYFAASRKGRSGRNERPEECRLELNRTLGTIVVSI
jgi:hypothetical protein